MVGLLHNFHIRRTVVIERPVLLVNGDIPVARTVFDRVEKTPITSGNPLVQISGNGKEPSR